MVSEERTRLQEKSVEMVAKAKACKEKIAVLGKKLKAYEESEGVGKEENAVTDRQPDVVPGISVTGREVQWLRLL